MKKPLSTLLAIIMLLSSVVFSPYAHAQVAHRDSQAERICVMDELREPNSDTYPLSDGSYECVVYSEDKYYRNTRGEFSEIDNSIIKSKHSDHRETYAYRNAAGNAIYAFSEAEASVLIRASSNSLSFSLKNSNASQATIGGIEKYSQMFDYPLSGKNCLSYTDVCKSTDLVYTVTSGTLKEFIFLKERSAASTFTFGFQADGLYARKTELGTVEFIDSNDEAVFVLDKLFALDAAGAYTDELSYEIVSSTEGSAVISFAISNGYLNDPSRVFPILIDPSVTITGAAKTYDSFVSSEKPTTNYQMSTALRTGKDEPYGVRRTYIKFDIPSSVCGKISNAYIRIKKNSGASPSVRAYRVLANWSSNTVVWYNKPSFDNTASSLSTHISNDWYKIGVTNIVKTWVDGTKTNYGFMLKDATETNTSQWTTFYSSEAASPNKPELHITYSKASLTMYSYLDNGFITRFPDGMQYVNSYHSAVKRILESEFPLNVNYSVSRFTSYCDICKTQNNGNWDGRHLTGYCSHAEKHLSVRPDENDTSQGFYFHFIRTKGGGTETTSKYFWTGHIPSPSDQPSFSVQKYSNGVLHNIVCIMPGRVTEGPRFSNKEQNAVDTEYQFTLLHETGHQLGAPDHYCLGDEFSDVDCGSKECWRHGRHLSERPVCCMLQRISPQITQFCSYCQKKINSHLNNHY